MQSDDVISKWIQSSHRIREFHFRAPCRQERLKRGLKVYISAKRPDRFAVRWFGDKIREAAITYFQNVFPSISG
jgi:hypothetical protein